MTITPFPLSAVLVYTDVIMDVDKLCRMVVV